MLYGVIIAGGSGKRLWPKSRKSLPKFFLKIGGKQTLLEQSVSRLKQVMPLSNILIMTNRAHIRPIRRLLLKFPAKNIIAEPVSKNTAAAVALAAALVRKRDPEAVMLVTPSDQVIRGAKAVKRVFNFSAHIARMEDSIITIGIKPERPATGYGYIKAGKPYKGIKAGADYGLYKADRFTEKPSLSRAKLFLNSKKYFWNSGIFIAKAEVFLSEYRQYKPSIAKPLAGIEALLGTKGQQQGIYRYFRNVPAVSMDYAIMEKTKRCLVVDAGLKWDDIGSWNALAGYMRQVKYGNYIDASHIGISTKGSIIVGKKRNLIATLGIDNLIIVQTEDVTLVCSRRKAEEIKRIVDIAQKRRLARYI